MIKFGSYLQPNWDWRAAGNFMFGGTGSALMLFTALATWPNSPPAPLAIAALAFVAGGLLLVWLEIGRTWRFINVLFHPQRSWMTREASVATLLFILAVTGLLWGNAILIACAGVVGLLFLYCQARILRASKGIPAWREPALQPLVMGTGLSEGCAVVLVALGQDSPVRVTGVYLLLALLVLRSGAWFNYLAALRRAGAPKGALERLRKIQGLFLFGGNLVPIGLGLAYLFMRLNWLLASACVLALLAGWHMKFVLVAKASYVQGYGIGKLKKGRPRPRKPVRRMGDPWKA